LSAARSARATVAAFPGSHRTSFIYHQDSAHELLAMACIYGLRSSRVVIDLHKSESAGLAGEPVTHYGHGINRYATVREEILQILFIGGIGEVSYKKLLH
jgi:hypothetical protein